MSRGCCCTEITPIVSNCTNDCNNTLFATNLQSLSGWTTRDCGQGGSFSVFLSNCIGTAQTGAAMTYDITRPALNGMCLSASCSILTSNNPLDPWGWNSGQPASQGVTIGDAVAFNFLGGTSYSYFVTNSNGCFSSGVVNATGPLASATIRITIQDISSGEGIYQIQFCNIGASTPIAVIDEIELTLPETLKVGIIYDFTAVSASFYPHWYAFTVKGHNA